MNYENKYKDALERAKKYHTPDSNNSNLKAILELIFPELVESEDERIRKELIEYLTHRTEVTGFIDEDKDCKRWIAWLEKQKDASKAIEAVDRIDKYIDERVVNAHDMKDSNPDKKYYRGWDDALGKMAGILQDVYSNEKQKELLFTHHEIDESLQDAVTHQMEDDGDVDDFVRKGIDNIALKYAKLGAEWQKSAEKLFKEEYVKKFKVLCDAYEIKLPNREYDIYGLCKDLHKLFGDSQKPAEWSEEDENKLNHILEIVHIASGSEVSVDEKEELESFLKSLRPQTKQEWSDEDEEMLHSTIEVLEVMPSARFIPIKRETMIPWLESLPQRFNLQPKNEWSEEDVECYNSISNCLQNQYVPDSKRFKCLYWLKSLRPQPHWKPSEEQMDAFRSYIKDFQEKAEAAVGGWNNFDVMIRLYEQLKKLM